MQTGSSNSISLGKRFVWVLQGCFLLDGVYGLWGSLVAQSVKNLPAMQETQVQFLGGADPLEKEMATHSSVLAWRIPQTEEPGRLRSIAFQESETT